MSCCGAKVQIRPGSPCPKCGKFKSNAVATVKCPHCGTFFIPRRK
jgi:ribosomal protein L32